MGQTIQLHDLTFKLYRDQNRLREDVRSVAGKIAHDYANTQNLEVLVILNGAFIFAADLLRALAPLPLQVNFTRYASYQGTTSTGTVRTLLELPSRIVGKPVLLVEDIVDSGRTIEHAVSALEAHGVESVRIASMFFKPANCTTSLPIDYVGLEIPSDFVVGYGMDYNGLGRNLPDLYIVDSTTTKGAI